MISRRTATFGILALPFVCTPAAAIGLPASPEAYSVLDGANGLVEGGGAIQLNILFTPWCSAVPGLFLASRSLVDRLRLRWIPYSGGMPEGREATEILLRNGDTSLIPSAFVAMHQADTRQPTPLSDLQDAYISTKVQPVIVRDTGGTLKIPTLVYRLPGDRVRLLGGSVSREMLASIADVAG